MKKKRFPGILVLAIAGALILTYFAYNMFTNEEKQAEEAPVFFGSVDPAGRSDLQIPEEDIKTEETTAAIQ